MPCTRRSLWLPSLVSPSEARFRCFEVSGDMLPPMTCITMQPITLVQLCLFTHSQLSAELAECTVDVQVHLQAVSRAQFYGFN